ncbi:MAG TPA: single-stranded-DNA-specific exonuclease RecJ [Bacteroidales bacterium]|nr:single-stranded-DNA-specific exonuclease RecJ [Bacteroidales bacterium]HPT51685.1 single-stranded-DNA-specific exonuclease RecJ [Bacteroidales bacterium]
MEKRWILTTTPSEDEVENFSQLLSIEKPLAGLLMKRGIKTVEDAQLFFNPDISKLHDPFLMKDMDKAVERLSKAVIDNEKILIYGDYDVDGTSAVALVYSFLKEIIGSEYKNYIEYYIPDRYLEGYGISDQGIEYCHANDFTLLISLDCGIKANDKVDFANSYGIDVIICDHHLAGDELPKAVAVLDPKCEECPYPYKELSGCGVGFKLIQGYCKYFNLPDQLWLSKLDLVAISIASDIVAITGENRILAYFGLIIINRFPRVGIKSIIEQSGIKVHYPPTENTIFNRIISISDLVFNVGPRINAAGRINTGRESVKLLICDDEDKSMDIGKNINTHNDKRRELDKIATSEAINEFLSNVDYSEKKSIVLYNPDWNKGIIGIVASRLVEEFYRPTIILTKSTDGLITGSARSIKEFNIYNGINHCADLLEHFGGHNYAAGLSLKEENLKAFSEKFEKFVEEEIQDDHAFVPEIEVDMELDLTDITSKFVENLKKFAPFGPGNMAPIFLSRHLVEEGNARIVGEKHIKLRVLYRNKNCHSFDAIAFNQKENFDKVISGNDFDLLYHVEENTWNNITSIQLNVKDIKSSN